VTPETVGATIQRWAGITCERVVGKKQVTDPPHAQIHDRRTDRFDRLTAPEQRGIRHPNALGGDSFVVRNQLDNAIDVNLLRRLVEAVQQGRRMTGIVASLNAGDARGKRSRVPVLMRHLPSMGSHRVSSTLSTRENAPGDFSVMP